MGTVLPAVLARNRVAALAGLAAPAGIVVTIAVKRAVTKVLLCKNSLRLLEMIVGSADYRENKRLVIVSVGGIHITQGLRLTLQSSLDVLGHLGHAQLQERDASDVVAGLLEVGAVVARASHVGSKLYRWEDLERDDGRRELLTIMK